MSSRATWWRSGQPAFKRLKGKRVAVSPGAPAGCAGSPGGELPFVAETIHLGHGAGWGEMDFFPAGWRITAVCGGQGVRAAGEYFVRGSGALLDIVGVAVHAVNVAWIVPGRTWREGF